MNLWYWIALLLVSDSVHHVLCAPRLGRGAHRELADGALAQQRPPWRREWWSTMTAAAVAAAAAAAAAAPCTLLVQF